jgi:hypothetical protein
MIALATYLLNYAFTPYSMHWSKEIIHITRSYEFKEGSGGVATFFPSVEEKFCNFMDTGTQ